MLIRLYEPVCAWSLRWKWLVLAGAVALVVADRAVYQRLGSEFMPPLDEGTLLYMPSTLPGISVTEAQRLLQTQDRIIKQFPEVDRVLGKAGRAETSTDPAPFSMMETVIVAEAARPVAHVDTWYSDWAPEWLKPALRTDHQRSALHRPARPGAERGPEAARRRPTPGRCRSRRVRTC